MPFDPSLPVFFCADLDVYAPGQTGVAARYTHLSRPHMFPHLIPTVGTSGATTGIVSPAGPAPAGTATVLPVGGPAGVSWDLRMNATFGTTRSDRTVSTRAQLFGAPGAVAYPFYIYGVNPGQAHTNSVRTGGFGSETYYGPYGDGADGLYANYRARHVQFDESSSHNLHKLNGTNLTLRGFAGLDGNSSNVYAPNIVSGMLRFRTPLRPGDYMEIRCQMPKGRYAWPAFWTNPGEQDDWNSDGTPGIVRSSTWPPENDIFDQYGFNGVDPGRYLIVATPDNGHPDRYNVGDVNMPGASTPFVDTSVATWEAGWYANTTFDQTTGMHTYGCYMGLDGRNYYFIDGVLYRIRSHYWPETKPAGHVICSLQPGPNFNDLSAMTDQGGVTNGWDWAIEWVRIWRTPAPVAQVNAPNPMGATFNTIVDFTPTGGTLGKGAVGQGWSDPNNMWNQPTNGLLVGGVLGASDWWATGQLVRSNPAEARVNSRVTVRHINFTHSQHWTSARVTGSGTTQTMIIAGPGKVACIVAGVRVDDQGTAYYNPTYTWLDTQVDVLQFTPTKTMVTVRVSSASSESSPALAGGTLLHTFSAIVTTPAVQNLLGQNGMFFSYEYEFDNRVSDGVYNSLFDAGQVTAGYKLAEAITTLGSDVGVGTASTNVLRASDSGYRSAPTDTPALAIYPPTLMDAFNIDRRLNLDPGGASSAVAWGKISFSNAGGAYDAAVATNNSDGRTVTVRTGQRVLDRARGYFADPGYDSLGVLFTGLAQPWALSETSLDVPIRDAGYWLEQPLQSSAYTGAGGYGGGVDLLGLPIPKTRGTVLNVRPVLVDATNRIYQWTDGPGTLIALYEGGDTNITFQANTSNLYSGTTTSGQYRTDTSRGLFQLGATPVRTITVDATGAFPAAGNQTNIATIARYLISEDMALPAAYLSVASFVAVAGSYPYTGGVYFGPDPITGTAALDALLVGAAMKLLPLRSGALALFAMNDVSASMPIANLGPDIAVSCVPTSLPTSVDPSPFRFRVGYQHNYTPKPSDVSPAVGMTRRAFLDAEYRYAGWSSAAVLLAYRRPNDPAPVPGALSLLTDAQLVANRLGALWGVRRRLYAVTVPIAMALAREMGDVVTLTWPTDDLRAGRIGQIVGEQIRSADATSTLYVLV